ncbi:MAG: nodulation protein NfeD [Halioglobus sp.]
MSLKPHKLLSLWLLGLLIATLPSISYGKAWLIDVDGAIGPAMADHTVRALEQAADANAEIVILRIDTPGGLDSAMREMIKSILASPLPVVGWVGPSGARAASAGTYLLYASHVSAMASGTNLGAATPVQIGSPGLPSSPSKEPDGEAGKASAMEKKIVNDAVAYIQSLAQLRGRNEQWAESAVRDGASLSAEDAYEQQVIEILADSTDSLLEQLTGREIALSEGAPIILSEDLALHHHPMDWRSKFLSVITDPNVAYILMLVGIYGLIIEFYNPGFGLPGVMGAVCLLLALYSFQVLPVSYAGLALIVLGIGLMVSEAMAPSFGIFGLGGIAAFVVGSIMLMDTQLPGYRIAVPIIVAFTGFSVALLVIALGLVLKARKRDVVTGPEHLLGANAEVEVQREDEVFVRLDGELWQVSCDQSLAVGDTVIVDAFDGISLKVSKQ